MPFGMIAPSTTEQRTMELVIIGCTAAVCFTIHYETNRLRDQIAAIFKISDTAFGITRRRDAAQEAELTERYG